MADQDVRIVEADLDSDSMWAREATLEKLLAYMEKIADLSKEQKAELESGFNDMAKTGKVTRDNLKKQKTKSGGGDGNMFGDATSGLANFTGEVVGAADNLDDLGSGPVKKFGKGLVNMTKKMGAMGVVAGAIMNQIGAAISTIKETVDAMRQLNSVGVTVEGGLMAFQEHLETSNMTIEQLAEITGKYARTVSNVGIKSLVDMTAAAEQSGFAFKDYGLLLSEATDYQAQMLESQRLGGLFKMQDEREQSMALAENVKTLTAYSKILNVSREDMLSNTLELKKRADVQRRFNSMDDDSRVAANASFDQFAAIMTALGPESQGLTDMITTMIADPAAVNSEAFKQLAGASPEVAQAMLDLRAKIEAGEEISQEDIIGRLLGPLDKASKSGQLEMLSMNDALGDTVNLLGGPVLNSLRNWETRIAGVEGATSPADAIEKLANATNESVQKATEAQQALDEFAATVKNARVKVFENLLGEEAKGILDTAIGGLRKASNMVGELGGYDYRGALESMVETFQLYIVEPFRTSVSWITDQVENMKVKFGEFFTWLQDIPARIWNAMAAVLPIDPVELPSSKAANAPAFPKGQQISDIRSATQTVENRQSLLDQATAGGATDAQLEIFERAVVAAEATLAQIVKLRTENRDKEG